MTLRISEYYSFYLEEEECYQGWWTSCNSFREAEAPEQRWCMEECREGSKDTENVHLRYCEQLRRVSCVPVPQFVGKDSLNFTRSRCLDEGVEDDDVLRPW